MSAMHWEARRRQNAMDRRWARNQQLSKAPPESVTTATAVPVDPSTQQPAVMECCHCQAKDNRVEHSQVYSAKIDNRYSSTQYAQQW